MLVSCPRLGQRDDSLPASAVACGSVSLGHRLALVEHVGCLSCPQFILSVDLVPLSVTAAPTAGVHAGAEGISGERVIAKGIRFSRRF